MQYNTQLHSGTSSVSLSSSSVSSTSSPAAVASVSSLLSRQSQSVLTSGLQRPKVSLSNSVVNKELEAHRKEMEQERMNIGKERMNIGQERMSMDQERMNIDQERIGIKQTQIMSTKQTQTIPIGQSRQWQTPSENEENFGDFQNTGNRNTGHNINIRGNKREMVDVANQDNHYNHYASKSRMNTNMNMNMNLNMVNHYNGTNSSHVDKDGFTMPETRRTGRLATNLKINTNNVEEQGRDIGKNNNQNGINRGRSHYRNNDTNNSMNGNNNNNNNNIRDRSTSRSSTMSRRNNNYTGGIKVLTISEAKEQINELKNELNQAKMQNEQLQGERQELENELNTRNDEHLQELDSIQSQIRELEYQLETLQISNQTINSDKHNIQAQLDMSKNQCSLTEQVTHNALQQVNTLQSNITMKESILQSQESEIKMIKSQIKSMQEQYEAQVKQMAEQNQCVQNMQQSLSATKQEIQQTKTDNIALQLKTQSLSSSAENQAQQIAELESARQALESTLSVNNSQLMQKRSEAMSLKTQCDQLDNTCSEQLKELLSREDEIRRLEQAILGLQNRARKEEELRKQLHNTIQELKGNIRVYCRVRPVLNNEEQGKEVFEYPEQEDEQQPIVLIGESSVNYSGQKSDNKRYYFNFDRVFKPVESQADVFEEISQLVQSALDGYKVCIFAYGQTGSGKTYTMEGPSLKFDGENRGMIPRAIEQIFCHAESLTAKGWRYQFVATFLEIYNEKVRDLLASRDDAYLELVMRKDGKNKNEVEVSGLTQYNVQCAQSVYPLLARASKNRSTGKTDCNEHSSRSHSVFQLYLTGTNSVTQQQTFGVLNLIDLAGSERLKKSNAQGQQLVETQNINSSLCCLGDVISALSNKSKHIPYRNSKLTHLLMNYFGGQSKTLMFVNLCPEPDKFDESLCSLRFAAKVNDCQIGVARRSVMNQNTFQ